MCDKGFIWNPSNCEGECDKSCGVGEYLDYKNCKCRKWVIDKLVEKCSEKIDGNEMIHNGTLNDYGKICNSYTVYIVLLKKKKICWSNSLLNIKMRNIKEININVEHITFDDMINIKNFDSNLLKADKKSYKNIDIYYITIKDYDYKKN